MMTLRDLFELNEQLTKDIQFSKWQWEEIVDAMYSKGNNAFDWSVENFYTGWLGFDYENCKDLITDIQNGNVDAFERFVNDIVNYFNED